MKIKGSSVIELTDVNTGKVQSFKDENLVTAAVPKALAFHLGLAEKSSSVSNAAASNLLPVVPNAIGGILCYEDRLDENPGIFYAEPENKIVGCSSNNSHSTTSAIRGSINAVESGPLEDGKGYRFVFDFGTSQGNGTISAIALTSRQGGVSGYGDHVNPYSCAEDVSNYTISINTSNYEQYIDVITALMYAVSVRYDKNDLIAIIPLSSGDLEIVSVPFPTSKVDLTGGSFYDGSTYRVLATVTPSGDFFGGAAGTTSKSSFYGSFFDGEDGYWWGFSYRSKGSAGAVTVYWAKIDQETFAITEGTWTLDNITTLGYSSVPFSQSLDQKYWTGGSYIRTHCPLTFGGGYLYMLNYNMDTVYKINRNNPTDIKAIKIKAVSTTDESNRDRPYQRMRYIHGRVYLPTGFIDADNMFTEAVIAWGSIDGMQLPVTRKDQIYAFSFGKQSSYLRVFPVLISPYLATINNLAKPVVKTADKTMKITYILREE